jgi:hypothetical protein
VSIARPSQEANKETQETDSPARSEATGGDATSRLYGYNMYVVGRTSGGVLLLRLPKMALRTKRMPVCEGESGHASNKEAAGVR